MADDAVPESSLRANFARAQRQLQAINSTGLASSNVEYQQQALGLVNLLKTCVSQVNQLSLFSNNETPDDYSTSELKLLLIGAYLGEALQKISVSAGRVTILNEAIESYKLFLQTTLSLGLVDKRTVDVERLVANEPSSSKPPTASTGNDRMQKIERFKQQRAMQQYVSELEVRLAGGDKANSAIKDDDVDDVDMDEVEREYAMKLIEFKVYQVVDDLSILKDELKMAKQMEEMMKQRGRESDQRNGSNASPEAKDGEWRLDSQPYHQIDPRTGRPAKTVVFNSKGQPTQPFVLTNSRQAIKDSVFRPGWALPTMTVDEYLEQEQQRGNIISGGGKEPDAKPDIEDSDYEALDAETMKKREWDEFTDNNLKGAGNRGGNRG
ncbi:Type 2A phosphatase-associated protein 42 [Coemansia thaxteri]|nr:Type 2A phosphatase-associated protein 42 [Coemansia thaxteri]KAJ2472765.1 Type 2A phosphatase-associated protein 42 [Coemansia sp. RSA 2322]